MIGDLSNGDLSLVHDGNNSVIRNRTGDLYISNATHTGVFLGGTNGEVKANYGGNLKFETENAGVKITGRLRTTGDLDVDGRTELDITNISETLNVTGISTFSDTVKIGTGVTALTDGNVSIGGTFEIFESSGITNRNFSQFKLSNFSIGQHQNTGSYKIINSSTGHLLLGGGNGCLLYTSDAADE